MQLPKCTKCFTCLLAPRSLCKDDQSLSEQFANLIIINGWKYMKIIYAHCGEEMRYKQPLQL